VDVDPTLASGLIVLTDVFMTHECPDDFGIPGMLAARTLGIGGVLVVRGRLAARLLLIHGKGLRCRGGRLVRGLWFNSS
jgi:hypothetical protein